MSEHDSPTFTGLCSDCEKDIVIGTRCPPCGVKSLLAADLQTLVEEHGPACCCMTCVRARARLRSAA